MNEKKPPKSQLLRNLSRNEGFCLLVQEWKARGFLLPTQNDCSFESGIN